MSSVKSDGGGKMKGSRGLYSVPPPIYMGDSFFQGPLIPLPQLSLFPCFPSELSSDHFWFGAIGKPVSPGIIQTPYSSSPQTIVKPPVPSTK